MANKTGNFHWGPAAGFGTVPNEWSYTLDDSDDAVAAIFRVPKDGTLEKIGVYVQAVNGNPPPYHLAFYVVTGAGIPDTATPTLYGGCAVKAYDFTVPGWIWVTLDTGANANAGDLVAAVLKPNPADPPDGANNIEVRRRVGTPDESWRGIQQTYYTTSWQASGAGLSLGVMYTDNSIALPSHKELWRDIDTGTDPDEVGALFQVPFDCQCTGAFVSVYPEVAGSDFTVKLYSAADVVLASLAVDASQADADTTRAIVLVMWDSVNLTADTNYRLTVLPGGLQDVQVASVETNELASREWFMEGERWQETRRADAGAWSEDATRIPIMGLWLTQITLPEGGGGGESAHGMIIS